MRRLVLLAILLGFQVVTSPPARAERGRPLCAAAAKVVRGDASLAEAVRAAFGPAPFGSRDEACTYPLKRLHYADADILLTQAGVPGEACHGCASHLSAFVLQRADGGLKLVRTLPDFAQAGTSGDAGTIAAVTIGGDDGLAIESGGLFQGYSFRALDLYRFRAGRAVHLVTDGPLLIAADDSGAVTDDKDATSVTGTWSIDPAGGTKLVVDYKVRAHGRTRADRAVWSLRESRLVQSEGHVPPELKTASGGG